MLQVEFLCFNHEEAKDVKDLLESFLDSYTRKTHRLTIDGLKVRIVVYCIDLWQECQKLMGALCYILTENDYLDFGVKLELNKDDEG